ncbi:MAG: hypothetical protein OXU20_04745 [Myxococcales bacterium]|nr:hypothetical protein [Myxococcales bacterium]
MKNAAVQRGGVGRGGVGPGGVGSPEVAGLILGAVVALALGCDGGEPPAAPPNPTPPTSKPAEPTPGASAADEADKAAAEKPPAELAASASDPSFQLSLKPAGPYAAGKLGTFVVDLEPRGEYHVNEEYPMSVTVSAGEGLNLPKKELKKDDAAEFGEKRARFEVPFTPATTGEHRVQAHVRFAVCTPETCVPDERKLALALPVE